MGWQGRQKHHGRASAWSLVWGAGRGWAEELSYPGLLLPQTQLKHKLIIIHSQINGATRALEDVRARQEAMWVSGRACHHWPGPRASHGLQGGQAG